WPISAKRSPEPSWSFRRWQQSPPSRMASTDSRSAALPTDSVADRSALDFRVERFSDEHLEAVTAFSERYWSRPRTASFYQWRYVDSRPFLRMYIALAGSECLGMISALQKTYLIGGTPVPCLEIFDWHSLPGLKGSGVGLRVIRALIRHGERLFG